MPFVHRALAAVSHGLLHRGLGSWTEGLRVPNVGFEASGAELRDLGCS